MEGCGGSILINRDWDYLPVPPGILTGELRLLRSPRVTGKYPKIDEAHELSRLQLGHVYAGFPPQHHLTQHHPSSKTHTYTPWTVPAPYPQPELLPIRTATPERNLADHRRTPRSGRAETQTLRNHFEIRAGSICFGRVGAAQKFRNIDESIH